MSKSLQIVEEPDCGNAPRRAILRDLAVALTSGDADAAAASIADNAVWRVVGHDTFEGSDQISAWIAKTPEATELKFGSVITHGREASMSGTVSFASGDRVHFSHVFHFANTGKNALITRAESWLVNET